MSAPEIYSDDNGMRLVYRHAGPPGRGLPPGGTTGQIYVKASDNDYDGEWANAPDGTGAAVGPASSLDATVVLFDGTTGKLLKDSTRTIGYFASRAYADATFVVKSGDKVLTDINFSSDDKTKLDSLSLSGAFFGEFADEAALNASSDVKLPGAYAIVFGTPAVLWFWDTDAEVWTTTETSAMSSGEIALALFNSTDSATYSQSTCRIFTTALKTMLESHDSILNSSGFGTVAAYGALAYFNTTGVALTFVGASDGSTNMVKADVPSAMDSVSLRFDNGGSNNGRLRYTGSTTQVFKVTAHISEKGASGDDLVFGIAKNGSLISNSRILNKGSNSAGVSTVCLECLVSLALNDYVEAFVGNMTDTTSTSILVLNISAVRV